MSPTLCAGLSMGISNTIILIISVLFLVFFLLNIKRKGYLGMHMNDPEPEVSELVFEDENEKAKDEKLDIDKEDYETEKIELEIEEEERNNQPE